MSTSLENNPDFKYAIGWNKFNLSLVSSWPTKDEGFMERNVIPLFIGSVILFFVLLPELAVSLVYFNNLDVMVHLLSLATPSLVAVIKLFNICSNRDALASLVQAMADDYQNSESKEDTNLMLETGKLARIISILSTVFAYGIVITNANAQLILGDTILPVEKLDPRIQNFFLLSYLPFHLKGKLSYWAMWMIQFSLSIIAAITYGTSDCLLVMFIFHACGQFKMIQQSLKKCVSENQTHGVRMFYKELRLIVEKHTRIMNITDTIENSFNKVILIQLISSALTFCVQTYAMMEFFLFRNDALRFVDFYQMIFSVVYMTGSIMLLFVFCWSAENLIDESGKIFDAWYQGAWYNLLFREQQSLLLIGFGSMKPLRVTAGKFTVISLDLFVKVLKTSAGYLSMLLAVRSQE